MVVGMRRTTRVFGVVKSGDGARILRSGRKIYSEPSNVVVGKSKKSNNGRVEWLKLLDEDDCKNGATGWCGGHGSVRKIEAQSKSRNEACKAIHGLEMASRMEIVNVYERKRKRFDWDVKPDGLAKRQKDSVVGKMFGNCFVPRQQTDGADSACHPGLVVMCTSQTSVRWLPRLLNSVLAYLMKHGVKLIKLRGFLCSNPICSIFYSQGIQFVQKYSDGSGYCKIYGVTKFAPLFSVNFSAIPAFFIYVHSSMLLQSEKLVFTYLVNISRNTDGEALNESDECIASVYNISEKTDRSPIVNNIHRINIVHSAKQCGRVGSHQMRLRSSFSSSKIRGKRSAPRSRRGRCVFVGDSFQRFRSCVSALSLQKTNGAGKMCESPISDLSCNLSKGDSVGLLEELKDSPLGWYNSDSFFSPFSSKRVRRAGSNEFIKNNDEAKISSTLTEKVSCAANILVIDHDKCYRLEGASIMLELSDSNTWLIIVKKDGVSKYSHVAEMVMKPCTFNRATHNIIWTVNNDWKLEFPTREDWSIFKELYKVCSSRNLQAPSNKIIPVPGVRIVSNYDDTITAPYFRPDSYIRLDGSEVSRVLAKTSASYDIDSDDEEWLASYNEELRLQKKSHTNISCDTLEQIIDAIEKALYFSLGDHLNEMAIADICPEPGLERFTEVAYPYWLKNRKQKCPTLVRVLQTYKPRQVLDVGGSVMRKKRSFKRYAIQNGGMRRFLLEACSNGGRSG